jgi:hypothetical protein
MNNKTKRIMKQTVAANGYVVINLRRNNHQKQFYIHRLVATAFIPNPNKYEQVNHIDHVKTNNQISNLAWCSAE